MSWLLLLGIVRALGLAFLATLSRQGELRRMQKSLVQRERAQRATSRELLRHPVVDLSRCLGCGTCVTACPEDDVLALVHGQAVVVNGTLPVGSDVTDFAIDRERERVVYVARQEVAYQDFEWELHSVPILGGASPLLLADDPDVSFGHPRILDGGRVLFENGSTLRTVPGLGGAIQAVLNAQSPWRYELSQDERRVVFVDPNGIQTVSSRGGAVTTLAAPVQLDVLQNFQQDGPVVVFRSRTGEVEELYASHYRPRSRQAATPTETRSR